MGNFKFIILLTISTVISAENQDWSPINGAANQLKECHDSKCMTFCRSINPGTVMAQCGDDKISCICTSGSGPSGDISVKVKFIEERSPVPPTIAPPQPPSPVTPEPTNMDPDMDNVPQLLLCDGSATATEVCNYFCINEIRAFRGLCRIDDFTCLCQGVSPAVVQSVPIPAVLHRPLPPPAPTTPRPPPQQNFWVPITPNHPNYNQNFYPPGYQNQHQYNSPHSQYTPSVTSDNSYHNHPTHIPVFDQMEDDGTFDGSEFQQNPTENPIENSHNSSISEMPSEPQRKRRSAGSAYANVYSSLGVKNEKDSCSIFTCQQACAKNNFNLPKCLPQCTAAGCICICKPGILSVLDSVFDVLDDDKEESQGQGMGTFEYGSSTHEHHSNPMKYSQSYDGQAVENIFTPPPSLY